MISKIVDTLNIDVFSVPDDSFSEGEIIQNPYGHVYRQYRKVLDTKILDTFEVIEINKFIPSGRNIFLKNYDSDSIDIIQFKKVVNTLCRSFGEDTNGKTFFTKEDEELIESPNFYQLFSRSWETNNVNITLDLDKEENTFQLTIFSAL